MTFTNIIRSLLKMADMTPWLLARRCGYPYYTQQGFPAFLKIVAGVTAPDDEVMRRICKALNVSLAVFDSVTLPELPEPKG